MIPTAFHLFSVILALQFDPFFDWIFGFLGIFWIIFIVFFAFFFIMIIVVGYRACKASQTTRRMFDASKVPVARTTTRHLMRETLPTECPECDAPLKYNEVKWVGPRRAECPYCGNVVELQEEEVFENC
ncbi:MAG: hypothetical protein Q6364_07140 [Candidatus Hermodarchaeota archaeon]|nr:hypothetical protein [Candidatus Hermodarchaeota archaeon]